MLFFAFGPPTVYSSYRPCSFRLYMMFQPKVIPANSANLCTIELVKVLHGAMTDFSGHNSLWALSRPLFLAGKLDTSDSLTRSYNFTNLMVFPLSCGQVMFHCLGWVFLKAVIALPII